MPSQKRIKVYKTGENEFLYDVVSGNNRVVQTEGGFKKRYLAVRSAERRHPGLPIFDGKEKIR